MNLFILRHAIAADSSSTGADADRPLTAEGEKELRAVARSLGELELEIDVILSSPYLRARRTAEIVGEVWGAPGSVQLTESLTPHADSKELVQELNALKSQPKNILLVGHEPYLSEFISLLTTGDSKLSLVLKKAGFCKLSISSLRHGQCAELKWLLTPRLLGSKKSRR